MSTLEISGSSHPIEDVQSTVWTQSKQVMGSDALSFACLRHHEQLGKDSYSLKVDAKSPQDLKEKSDWCVTQSKNNLGENRFYLRSSIPTPHPTARNNNGHFSPFFLGGVGVIFIYVCALITSYKSYCISFYTKIFFFKLLSHICTTTIAWPISLFHSNKCTRFFLH